VFSQNCRELGIFRLEFLNEYKVRIEHIRSESNEELTETLHQHETEDSARFDRMERDWENRFTEFRCAVRAACFINNSVAEPMPPSIG
jgi:hypothetical protein